MVFCILLSEINNITFQICEFIILNWEYDADEQKILTVYDGIRLDSSYKENGEWRIAVTWSCAMDIYGQQLFLKVNLILTFEWRYFLNQNKFAKLLRQLHVQENVENSSYL